MRKFVRNQILELLSTVWEGIKKAKTLEPEAAECVLADCYRAIQCVEQTLQDGFSPETFINYADFIVSLKQLLEDMNEAIAQGSSVADITKKLKAELKKLRKTLLEEKEMKLEIVFFPYKASMWDALESIWIAARDDENCEAYVVPIPYYDRLPNGELGEMHYEGGLYPEYVPVVDWRAYNLENRCPDIAFIHNPYDKNNFVTTVHPDYYSYKLKRYVKCLVYSPYFVVGKTINQDMLNLPSYGNFDFILAQSEEIREQCINYMKAATQSGAMPLAYARNIDKRVLGLGSPKFDKVCNSKREDFTLPVAWAEKIAGKKVILYNTSLSALLRYNDRYIKKVKSVLAVFHENKDAALWWRPHPLMISTLQSMRPQLAAEWIKMVKEFQAGHWGIYDDTAELHRAIAWSDAYYGDESSVVDLYNATGKPMAFQNFDNPEQEIDSVPIHSENFIEVGDNYYFSSYEENALFCMNKVSHAIEYLGAFAYGAPSVNGFSTILHCDGVLYFTPQSADYIATYNIKNKTFGRLAFDLPVPEGCNCYWETYKFHTAFCYNGRLFFFPCTYPAIIVYEIATKEVLFLTDWLNEYKRIEKYDGKYLPYFMRAVQNARHSNRLMLACGRTNALFEFDMLTFGWRFHEFQGNNTGYHSLCFDGDAYYMIPSVKGQAVAMWTPATDTYQACSVYLENLQYDAGDSDFYPFQNIFALENETIWILPALMNMGIRTNKRFAFFSELEEWREVTGGTDKFTFVEKISDFIYAVSPHYSLLILYNCATNIMTKIPMVISKKEMEKVKLNALVYKIKSNQELPLSVLPLISDPCGAVIYHTIKQEVNKLKNAYDCLV